MDSLKLWLIIAITSGVVSLVFSKLFQAKNLEAIRQNYGVYQARSMEWAYSDVALIIQFFVGMVIGLVALMVVSWLVAKLTKWISSGKGDFEKTFGLTMYFNAAVYLLVSLPLGIIGNLISLALPASSNIWGMGVGSLMVVIGIVVLAILFVIWCWITMGKAVGIANDVTTGQGMVAILLAGIMIFAIMIVIMLILVAVFFAVVGFPWA